MSWKTTIDCMDTLMEQKEEWKEKVKSLLTGINRYFFFSYWALLMAGQVSVNDQIVHGLPK